MRHIISLSGGKDSSALAIYLKDRNHWRKVLGKENLPIVEENINYEYVFCDTNKELPETYQWLDKLEDYLGQPIVRVNDGKGFDYWLDKFGGFLPSPRARWCTSQLKIEPFQKYVGEDRVCSYIGIRADENRDGYVSGKEQIVPIYPFKQDGINHDDVLQILNQSGLGYPSYYSWRTRSGCYMCFFQRKIEWVGLFEKHPDLFNEAKAYEKYDPETGKRYTWSQNESLEELAQPERIYQIKGYVERKKQIAEEKERIKRFKAAQRSLFELLPEDLWYVEHNDDPDDELCLTCEK